MRKKDTRLKMKISNELINSYAVATLDFSVNFAKSSLALSDKIKKGDSKGLDKMVRDNVNDFNALVFNFLVVKAYKNTKDGYELDMESLFQFLISGMESNQQMAMKSLGYETNEEERKDDSVIH